MILQKLFEPIVIKGLSIKNRIVMPPMHTNQGNMEEGITDQALDFYTARAKGGFGMIGVGVIDTYFIPGASSPLSFFLMNDRQVKNHSKVVKEIKKYGAVAYAQIGVRRIWPVSHLHHIPKLSTISEQQILEMLNSVIKTAIRVREAGYDAVSLLGIGGGAISIFLSNALNDRTDKWGGNLEGKLRFPIEIIRGIRNELGEDYPVFFRMHGSEFLPGGYDVETEKMVAHHLEKAGVDFFNVSGGSHATSVPQLTPNVPRGTYAFLAREIKNSVSVPVAASNRIGHPLVAEDILRKGWADMVSLARSALADPDWPNKAKHGDFEDIRLCIACNECLDAVVARDESVCCLVNPKIGRLSEVRPLPGTNSKKRILVIGGGCTGLQAALTCAERGHQVTLIEKESFLGGRWRLAAAPPGREELFNFLHWLLRQVKKAGVDIRLGVKFTPELIRQLSPEAIIVCTGSKPRIPDIAGIDLPNVILAQDAIGGVVKLGEKVVVIGGGGVGIETALYLAKKWSSSPEVVSFLMDHGALKRESALSLLKKGHQVTLVVRSERIGKGLGPGTKWVLKKELDLANVQIIFNAPVKEIKENGVMIEKDGLEQFIRADTVVLATGFVPDTSVYESIKNLAPEVYIAGAATVGHMIEGIGKAFEVAMKIA
jgi:2,4-dienoyl-CoA reductase (NADPH2)